MNSEKWIEVNCACGISEYTNEWSEDLFDLFGCTCEPELEENEK